jgi:hypothetical protein
MASGAEMAAPQGHAICPMQPIDLHGDERTDAAQLEDAVGSYFDAEFFRAKIPRRFVLRAAHFPR